MAKKRAKDLPLPEELLDRSISVLEGPVNRVVERVLRSRLVLVPMGLSFKVTTTLLGLVLKPGPRPARRRHATSPRGH